MFRFKNRVPTDLDILEYIYKIYYSVFIDFDKDSPSRDAKIYVPIDCRRIADHFGVDRDIIFGRLYYHLEQKYAYSAGGAKVHFFANRLNEDIKCVNFPYMASVLADLQDRQRKYSWSLKLSIFAIAISAVSAGFTVYQGLDSSPREPASEVKKADDM